MRDAMWRGHGGWEMALSPVLVGFFGWLVDGWLDTSPIFLILGVILGLVGSVANQYYRYVDRMAVAEQERVAAYEAKFGPEGEARFGPTEQAELPDYAIAGDSVSEA